MSPAVAASCRASPTSAPDAASLCLGTSANFYEVLSLSPRSASGDDVKRAFRSMALRYHPDVCDPSEKEQSTRAFLVLHEAYRTLSDPALKEEYDCSLGLVGGMRFAGGDRMVMRRRWEEQVMGLKRRSGRGRRSGTWGSIMRSRNNSRANNGNEDED
ncbi:hypothetical protein MLD38_026915 [Melastoma candidum]|nr:hypothetical protein MLD38_026915 [Melastoma candidum]